MLRRDLNDHTPTARVDKEGGNTAIAEGRRCRRGRRQPVRQGEAEKLGEIDFTQPIKGGPNSHGFDYYYGDDVPNWPPYAWRENEHLIGNPTAQMKQGAMVGVSAGPAVADWDFSAVLLEYGKRCADYVRGRQGKAKSQRQQKGKATAKTKAKAKLKVKPKAKAARLLRPLCES